MESRSLPELLEAQRAFFATGATRDLGFRLEALGRLKEAIRAWEPRLFEAMHADFRKPPFESYATEVGLCLSEIRHHERHLRAWARPEKVRGSLVNFPSHGRILREPFGVALVMAPWNYPFQLLVNPLVGALSAGNCAVLKPAEYATRTSEVLADLIRETFPPRHVAALTGGRAVIQSLLEERFDIICFTGSAALGRVVMEKAARHLTPVLLELGGKSPCIVEADADLEVAARRIAWGKFLNAGQTCVAPDHLYVHESVRDRIVDGLRKAITRMYGEDPRLSPDFARIINDKQFQRLQGLLEGTVVLAGGETRAEERYVAPTLLDPRGLNAPVMREEIFGPLLPVLSFGDLDEVVAQVNARPRPLALYHFSGSRRRQEEVLARIPSGGVCLNDTVVHLADHRLPFGGLGASGMGGYHGWYSFDAFSHRRSVLSKGTWLDLPLRYAPYEGKLGLVRRILG